MSETLFLQLCRLGDCLQSTVLLSTWRQRHPGDRTVILTRSAFSSAFAGNPDVDEILVYDPPNGLQIDPAHGPDAMPDILRDLVETLRRRRFNAVVNLTHDPLSGWLILALRPRLVRGLSTDAAGKVITRDPWSLYLLSLLNFRSLNLVNLVDIYARLSGGPALREIPRFVVDEESRADAARRLVPAPAGACFIGFQPGASRAERRWPGDCFVSLGRELHRKHNARILIFGSREEEPLASSIAGQIPGAESFAGRTTLAQLAALLEKCRVLVTNDTGTMHVAAAMGVRIVALFESSAYFRETGPYGAGHWILQSRQVLDYGERSASELEQIRRIPTEEALVAVDALLAETRGEKIEAPVSEVVDHYRSVWSGGLLDFLPARRVPLGQEEMCSRLQRPVWLTTLAGEELESSTAAEELFRLLESAFCEPRGTGAAEMLDQFDREVTRAEDALSALRGLIDITLEKLRKDPRYLIPEGTQAEMTELENEVLDTKSLMAVQPFIAYFETALAMVEGNSTKAFLKNYRLHVVFLDRQLRAFRDILRDFSLLTTKAPKHQA